MASITIRITTGNKTYDLTCQRDKATVKGLITRAIKSQDLARLKNIKNQLDSLPIVGEFERQELERINRTIAPNKGESRFQKIYAYLLADMANYTNDIFLLTEYSALVINMYRHIATFTPYEDHGQAQHHEFAGKSHMQYYRSQGKHASASLFRQLTQTPSSRLPFNKGFIKLIADNSEIKKIEPKTGLAKRGETVNSFVMTKIAHAGARKNNLATLIQGINTTPLNREALAATLQRILPPTKTITELSASRCTKRIHAYYQAFNELEHNHLFTKALSSKMLDYRIKRIQQIQQRIDTLGLEYISLDSKQSNITCLMIRLYPKCHITNDTYKEGVTNVLLSFFGGLLNHTCEQQGLNLYTTRRQSFGFLRPTITDAGCLTIRLSLGLEPHSFDDIIIDCLEQFNTLLHIFRFDDKTNSRVSKVFEYIKPPKEPTDEKQKIRAGDTYIRNAVRKDDKTLITFQQAKAYIDASNDDLEQAMRRFLRRYICRNIKYPVTSNQQPLDTVQLIDTPTTNLLQNTLTYTCNKIQALATQAHSALPTCFAHVSLHTITKLFKHAQRAQVLLNQYEQMDASEFYYQALLTIENCLEYLILLDGLEHIKAQLQGQPINAIKHLRNSELRYVHRSLNIAQSQLSLFFTDSGQQAITTSLLTLSIMLHGAGKNGKSYDNDIYLFGDSYYEIAEFITDSWQDGLRLETKKRHQAKIILVDISQISRFIRKFHADYYPAMKAVVIDMTHHPLFDQEELRNDIQSIHESGAWVVLVESSLKHAELGLDKYQAGKIITIAPLGLSLPDVAIDLFKQVSRDAIHPLTASYLSMVNTICGDKQPITPIEEAPINTASKDTLSAKALPQQGLFRPSIKAPKRPKEYSQDSRSSHEL